MNGKFVSIRTKFLRLYLVILGLVLLIMAGISLTFLSSYFRIQQENNLKATREIISSCLEENDINSPSVDSTLNTAANAMNISIWVCAWSRTGGIQVYCYGRNIEQEKLRIQNNMRTQQQIISIMNGMSMDYTRNAFPEIYDQKTISIAYQQSYHEKFSLFGREQYEENTGAVILNMSMSRVNGPQWVVFATILISMGFVTIIAMIMILIYTNNIIRPVKEMKEMASSVAEGDFSKEVTSYSNDEIGQLAESINSMTTDLKELENLRSGFIANISHDFRSPLTSIRGFLEAMLDGTIPQEMHPKYMQVVLDETNRLTKMTNNILDLTKMENGQDELKLSHFDVNEMIVKMAIGFEQRIEEKSIQMDFRFLQEKLYVNADLDKIQRVVYNLIDNALKFTSQGDTIRVETSVVGQKAMISISDTGAGIDEKALPHIFERFNKGDASRGNDKKGNGLGLTIVRQILLNHGEDIKVQSKLGEGTTFTFTLPLAYKINLVEKK